MKKIVIIGGGFSGMIAGIQLKKELKDTVEVTILERLEKVGKKILATGNGKCNFTNMDLNTRNYNDALFVDYAIHQFGCKLTRKYFDDLGLMSKELEGGRVYPITESAISVMDVLRINLRSYGVNEKCLFEAKKISQVNSKFLIESTRGEKETADILILATGGKAMPVLGSNGSGYSLLKPFKVKITPTSPGLVGVKVDKKSIAGLFGLRSKVVLSCYEKKNPVPVFQKSGEIIFKDDGISGIVMMELASFYARNKMNSSFMVDFLPEVSTDDLLKHLIDRRTMFGFLENSELLTGIVSKNLAYMILKKVHIDLSGYVRDLTMRDFERIVVMLKKCVFQITGTYDFDHAQITIGGVSLDEVNEKTMELKNCKNLYVVGELLDIDGACGGYNIQWALSSGMACSQSILTSLKEDVAKRKKSSVKKVTE